MTGATSADYQSELERFMKTMGQHLVVFTGRYASFNRDGTPLDEGIFAFSGCLLGIGQSYFWMTAGHCLKDQLDEPIRDGTLKLFDGGFADFFGLKVDDKKHRIPYTYNPGDGFYIEDKDRGLDFGIVPLDGLTVKGFLANGVKPVEPGDWLTDRDTTFDHYKMYGIPAYLTKFDRSASGRPYGGIQPAMVAIDPIDRMGDENPLSNEWFVGRLHPEAAIQHIGGMSGGPIYGFTRVNGNTWTYKIVALQSRWFEKTRTIFGCSLPSVANALVDALRKDHS